ncbi:MAG: ABC transporter substrate-binding protein [Bradyrhizobium canariense]
MVAGGQRMAALLFTLAEVHGLGLQAAQGLIFTEAWYWDANDVNRAFAKEFAAANKGNMPTMTQAGTYSAVMRIAAQRFHRFQVMQHGGVVTGDGHRRHGALG